MKIWKNVALIASTLLLVGCTNTVGNNVVNDKGQLVGDRLDWPKIEDAYQKEGIYPNLSNLEHIRKGLNKHEIYYFFKEPHFSEMNGADEWNYIFKFRLHDGTDRICQYKILFDDEDRAQSFYWLPKDCLKKPVEKINLNANTLFPFDLGGVSDIKPEGKQKLDEILEKLADKKVNAKVHLIGHTDMLGTDAYNMRLSKQRATSVRQYLINNGINPSDITYDWKGETDPIVDCDNNLKRPELIKCLQPNRRVSVEITRDFLNDK